MKKTKERRTASLTEVRLYPSEKAQIMAEYKASFYPSKSAFIRAKLLRKEISIKQNKHDKAVLKAGDLMDELNRIGVNINQIAKAMNTYQTGKIQKNEAVILLANLKLLNAIKAILSKK